MKKKKELCPHCGASMMVNKYTFNMTLLRALAKMARNPGKKFVEMGMSKSEYANAAKLKFWGFISKQEDGLWLVTNDGYSFLRGEIKAPKEISYFRNRIVDTKGMTDVNGILPTEESKQKYREWMEPING